MKKRILSLFLVLILAFVSVEDVHADAGSLIIAGGSVAGVTAGAIAGPAVVAVFCAMMAFGMNVELTQASEEAGMTKTQFLKNKIQEYCNEANMSATTFNNYVLDQAEVFHNGAISISDKAGQLIQKFCNWLFSSENVTEESSGIPSSVTIEGLACPVVMPGATVNVGTEAHGQRNWIIYNQGTKPLVFFGLRVFDNSIGYKTAMYAISSDDTAFTNFKISAYQNNQLIVERTYAGTYINDIYGCYIETVVDSNGWRFDIPVIDNYKDMTTGAINNVLEGIDSLNLTGNPNLDSVTGDMDDYNVSKDILNPVNDKTIIINPNITIPVPQDKDVTIDVNEYLDVVQDMIDGLRDDVITAIDDATDVPISIEFDPTQDWDPTIEKEDDTDLPPDDEKTPVIADDILPHDFDPDPMKFDLKGIFPFCIPWDVKDMLSKLSADPVAPSYTVNWLVPIVNERLIFTVDLSPFDGVAQVCRTMELLAFCIGLAVVTRQLFLRG